MGKGEELDNTTKQREISEGARENAKLECMGGFKTGPLGGGQVFLVARVAYPYHFAAKIIVSMVETIIS